MTRSYPESVRAIMSGVIEAKPAVYGRVPMRSRLEVAFARHLDEHGITWRYEPAIFGPRGAGYLPDFELVRPGEHHYVEVKPTLREVPEAQRRIAVIWSTYPDAVLIVACAEECRWFASAGGGAWTSWVDRWAHR